MKSETIKAIVGFLIGGGIVLSVLVIQDKHANPWPETSHKTVNIKTDTSIRATTVKVSQFYNGQNGFSLSIPSGNSSTCIWNWVGGNASIPYSQTTYANTATEKHTLTFGSSPNGTAVEISGAGHDFKVTCIDDFGNQYSGEF
jgi:hypothetical protein